MAWMLVAWLDRDACGALQRARRCLEWDVRLCETGSVFGGYGMAYFGMTVPADELWPDAVVVFDVVELILGVIFAFDPELHWLREHEELRVKLPAQGNRSENAGCSLPILL